MTDALSILVIDDDGISLAVVAMLLQAEDYDVLQASSGEEALQTLVELAGTPLPTVVLADLQMPGRSGAGLAADLRILVPQALLLAMSATPASAEGYDGFLKKPLDVGDLRAAIEARNLSPAGSRGFADGDAKAEIASAIKSDITSEIGAGAERPASAGTPPAPVKPHRILDEKVYQNLLRMMSPAAVEELYRVCLGDARERVERMRSSGECGDMDAIRQAAHAVKGGAGMVGARRLAEAAEEIEFSISVKEDLPQLLNNLLERCDELQRILLDKLTP